MLFFLQTKSRPLSRGEYNVYSTFQSHEPEFDYLKSLEIEEKINKIRWLPQQNAAHFLLSTNGKGPFFCTKNFVIGILSHLSYTCGFCLTCFGVVLMSSLITCKVCFDCNVGCVNIGSVNSGVSWSICQ